MTKNPREIGSARRKRKLDAIGGVGCQSLDSDGSFERLFGPERRANEILKRKESKRKSKKTTRKSIVDVGETRISNS